MLSSCNVLVLPQCAIYWSHGTHMQQPLCSFFAPAFWGSMARWDDASDAMWCDEGLSTGNYLLAPTTLPKVVVVGYLCMDDADTSIRGPSELF